MARATQRIIKLALHPTGKFLHILTLYPTAHFYTSQRNVKLALYLTGTFLHISKKYQINTATDRYILTYLQEI